MILSCDHIHGSAVLRVELNFGFQVALKMEHSVFLAVGGGALLVERRIFKVALFDAQFVSLTISEGFRHVLGIGIALRIGSCSYCSRLGVQLLDRLRDTNAFLNYFFNLLLDVALFFLGTAYIATCLRDVFQIVDFSPEGWMSGLCSLFGVGIYDFTVLSKGIDIIRDFAVQITR